MVDSCYRNFNCSRDAKEQPLGNRVAGVPAPGRVYKWDYWNWKHSICLFLLFVVVKDVEIFFGEIHTFWTFNHTQREQKIKVCFQSWRKWLFILRNWSHRTSIFSDDFPNSAKENTVCLCGDDFFYFCLQTTLSQSIRIIMYKLFRVWCDWWQLQYISIGMI